MTLALTVTLTAGSAGTKRKAAEGGASETDMEALERQARRLQVMRQAGWLLDGRGGLEAVT